MTEDEKNHRIAMIAGSWVKLCDNGEIRDRGKASLFKVISAKFANEYSNDLTLDEIYERDVILEPLKKLLMQMPRH